MTETYAVEMVELEPAHAVVLSRTVTASALSEAVSSGIERARSLTTAARVLPVGQPFVRYLAVGNDMEIEVGYPLARPEAIPGLRSTILAGGPAAATWHEGSHNDIGLALDALETWIAVHAMPSSPPWAHILADGENPLTRVVWPVRSR